MNTNTMALYVSGYYYYYYYYGESGHIICNTHLTTL